MLRLALTFFARLADDELSKFPVPVLFERLKRPKRPCLEGELGGLGAGNGFGESNSCGGSAGRIRCKSKLFVPRGGCVGTLGEGTSTSERVLRTLVNLFHIVDFDVEYEWILISAEQQRGEAAWIQLSSGPCCPELGDLEENHRAAEVKVGDKRRGTSKPTNTGGHAVSQPDGPRRHHVGSCREKLRVSCRKAQANDRFHCNVVVFRQTNRSLSNDITEDVK